jgi:hypothetical protein
MARLKFNLYFMGSSSKRHGLCGIEQRRPKTNVATRVRKTRLVAAKQPLKDAVQSALRKTPEVS